MASNAFSQDLLILLDDADELMDAHSQLRTGRPGRQWGLGSLNRAVVVMCVSAWESYVEKVIIEAIDAMRPVHPAPLGNWSVRNADARSLIGNFNNPDVANVRKLISRYLGLADITTFWFWKNCTVIHACDLLAEALDFRHQIAHGVNPRPKIHSPYATWLPKFFQQLGRKTDTGIRDYLVNTLGIANPWPP